MSRKRYTAEELALLALELQHSAVLSKEAACIFLGRISEDTLDRHVRHDHITPAWRGKFRREDLKKLADQQILGRTDNTISLASVLQQQSDGPESDEETRRPMGGVREGEAGPEGKGAGIRPNGKRGPRSSAQDGGGVPAGSPGAAAAFPKPSDMASG